ncbi:DUF6328 family protein [Salinibacterium sp. G-O1]|uniref:DUF6328 family protein n=1 Tax=Salinibacterium sp. G-O1 TaxID=3046208 RepID=UPI0024BA638A|nr:DUF6328 family protein [Salinibacterium sp. G-O1]MDJ0334763.1 DUF6328 family protein [Salinibacterium sp. G-O1]
MTSDGHHDADPGDGRDETPNERHDRNWTEILQELRVIQTGTQVLTGFLLTLAFQPRFADLEPYEVNIYLGLVIVAVLATVLALAPVSLHRAIFRRKAKGDLVRIANRLLILTIAAMGLTLIGTTMLIFDVAVGYVAGLIAGGIAALVVVAAWVLMPARLRFGHPVD